MLAIRCVAVEQKIRAPKVIVLMITPFADDDSIDATALKAEAKFLLESGVSGIVVGGSSGKGLG